MAKNNGKNGGFFRGVVLGFVVWVLVFAGLSYAFPIKPKGPQAVVSDIAQSDPQGFDVASDGTTGSGVVIGGTGDSVALPVLQEPIESTTEVQAPVVEAQSTGTPDIGDGDQSTQTVQTQTIEEQGAEAVNAASDESVVAVESTPPPALQDLANGSAIDVFSASFDVDPTKQVMAIILLDTQEEPLQPLLDTGVPFSFAIPADTDDPNAGRGFRDSGYEVLAMIPEVISNNGDMAATIKSYIEHVPVSVALIDNSFGSVLRDEAASKAFFEVVSETGHGAISFAGAGDIRAEALALRSGVPFGIITRVIDSDPDPFIIERALDRAALAAQTGGSAIVFARTRATTIESLVKWLRGDRAAQIQIVPASVVLRR